MLVEALAPRPGGAYLSVASAGDNTLALLARDPDRVIAVDVSAAQLACLELRVAAYRRLDHDQLLELVGSRPSARRGDLYDLCRSALRTPEVREFWDRRRASVAAHGLGGVGRFERYFRVFRRFVLPLVHRRSTVRELLEPRSRAEREAFYDDRWATACWRTMVRGFFSRRVMGLLGREPEFFAHAEGSVAEHVLRRTRHALVELDPAANPYLRWILTGEHGSTLPLALRADSVAAIRRNLDRLELRHCSVQRYAQDAQSRGELLDGLNLSDVFEYMPPDAYRAALRTLVGVAARGARLVYWNMLAPRSRPEDLADRLEPLEDLAADLYRRDKAFFYSRLCVEAAL